MAKGVTSDYFGLDTNPALELIGADEGQTSQAVNMPDENGDIVIEETYGERKTPSNSFSIIDDFDVAAAITLGAFEAGGVSEPGSVLTGFSIATANGTAPTVDVSGEDVAAGSVQGRTAPLPAQTLLKRHKAQILFGAFTITGEGVHLQSCNASGSINLTRSPDAEGIAWDVHGARIEVQATLKKSAATALTLTGGSNWIITSPLNLVESDKDYEEYSVTLALNIEGVDPAP